MAENSEQKENGERFQEKTVRTEGNLQLNMVMDMIIYGVNLVLRYYFLAVIIVIGYIKKIGNAIISPLQPIAAESRKVPDKDISIHGIVRTLTRLVFLIGLMWWSVVSRIFENLISPFRGYIDRFMSTARSYADQESTKIDGKSF